MTHDKFDANSKLPPEKYNVKGLHVNSYITVEVHGDPCLDARLVLLFIIKCVALLVSAYYVATEDLTTSSLLLHV